ncbi:MAG: hypothetical protein LUE14_10745 [Clostridiales bacterium]|nr:hypothetical protein [Clostridiales bacterium]MCD8110556.1 hypothetical protein [Clostridiales bacterium]
MKRRRTGQNLPMNLPFQVRRGIRMNRMAQKNKTKPVLSGDTDGTAEADIIEYES